MACKHLPSTVVIVCLCVVVCVLQIMVLHMREQLKELQSTKDALAVSKVREMTLQNQVVGAFSSSVYVAFF